MEHLLVLRSPSLGRLTDPTSTSIHEQRLRSLSRLNSWKDDLRLTAQKGIGSDHIAGDVHSSTKGQSDGCIRIWVLLLELICGHLGRFRACHHSSRGRSWSFLRKSTSAAAACGLGRSPEDRGWLKTESKFFSRTRQSGS